MQARAGSAGSSGYHSPRDGPGGEVDQLCACPTPEAIQQLSRGKGLPRFPPPPGLEAEQRTVSTEKEGAEGSTLKTSQEEALPPWGPQKAGQLKMHSA